ncbi:FAD-dependent oxidoreductase [Alphaproteobacteria bacterium]|nr:FAD-dependent oxidoreductase [Alphaproteobacteria bacterium]
MHNINKKKIAVIGSGIAGISASYFLSSKYDVHLFEKNNYLGGHTRTVKVRTDKNVSIDTGFIVFNDRNYPDLIKFFDHLDVQTINSDMSFAVSDSNYNIEYGGKNLKSLFAQYKNIFNISYIKMIYEIYRFYKLCRYTELDNITNNYTLEDFLQNNNFSTYLKQLHIYPLISSIWSTNQRDVRNFPLKLFLNFFNNHDLFNFKDRPQWKFVKGGSNSYIKKIIELDKFSFSLNTKIDKIIRSNNNIKIIKNDEEIVFDYVIIATHADQALQIINNPTNNEKEILSKFEYTKNKAYLHSDRSMMPKNNKTWSSWNFIKSENTNTNFTLTYWMNNLQKLQTSKEYFVTINPEKTPEYIHDDTFFTHPKFNLQTMKYHSKLKNLQGINNTYFCGAYHGYGFHEDGIQSAAYISKMLDVDIPWKRNNNFYNRLLY